jgi:hypothetical protein
LWAFLFRRDSMTSFSFSFPFKKMSNRCNDGESHQNAEACSV